MNHSKWPDFLLTVVIRFIGGTIMGCVGCLFVGYRRILKSFSVDDTYSPMIWLLLLGSVGGIVGIFTIPRWQTPWYKGIAKINEEK